MRPVIEHEQVISFDLSHCNMIIDDGNIINALMNDSVTITIPQEARDLFLVAWTRHKGCDLKEVWEGVVGAATFTAPGKGSFGGASIEQIRDFDPDAAEFIKNMKDLEERIKGVEGRK